MGLTIYQGDDGLVVMMSTMWAASGFCHCLVVVVIVTIVVMMFTMWAASGVADWRKSLSGRRAMEPAW